MAPAFKIPASLWLAVLITALGFGGAVVSLGVQRLQSISHLGAAAAELTGGDAKRGKAIISRVGCGACHAIPGVDRADGDVGPPLAKIASRAFLAGRLANNPTNLIAWVRHPQTIEPGNGMPDPPITDQEARDVAAYLYTLK